MFDLDVRNPDTCTTTMKNAEVQQLFISDFWSMWKWTVLGKSGQFNWVKVDGPKLQQWTVYESGRSKTRIKSKVDGPRELNWSVKTTECGRSVKVNDSTAMKWVVFRDLSRRTKRPKLVPFWPPTLDLTRIVYPSDMNWIVWFKILVHSIYFMTMKFEFNSLRNRKRPHGLKSEVTIAVKYGQWK